jgi:transposase
MDQRPDCPHCRELQAQVDALKRRVAELEANLRASKRQAVPFGGRTPRATPKKPGRKKGRGTFRRREPPTEAPIETIEVPLGCCPHCRGKLEDRKTHEHIQTDLPLPRPVHKRFRTESGFCPRCRKRVRSRHPDQGSTAVGAAAVSVGPNAKAVAADLHHRLGVPYAKVADHLHTTFGLDVTPSGLCQANARLADKALPVYDELIMAIRDCCAVHADETGWRIGTLAAWLWVFTSKTITVYVIDESRGHEVVVEILGREFKGVLVADCFLAYDHAAFADWLHQKCFAHFLKTLGEMEATKCGPAVRFAREVAAVLRAALDLRDEKATLPPPAFARRLKAIEQQLDVLIDPGRRFTDPDNRRFAARLRKHRDHLFTFLTHDGVDATNNRGERTIRPAVIIRKTGACNKTRRGAETHSILASVLRTATQRGLNAVRYVVTLLTTPGNPPSLLAQPHDSS